MPLTPILPLPHGSSLDYVQVNGVRLAVLDARPAQERATVHLVHGFNGSKEDFWPLVPHLQAAGYRVLAHDHRGINQSGRAAEYRLADLVSDIAGIHEELGISRVHLLGHSFGGLVAQEFALQHTVGSLTLLCSGPGTPAPALPWLQEFASYLSSRDSETVYNDLLISPRAEINFAPNPDPNSLYAIRWLNTDTAALVAQAHMLISAADHSEELSASRCPTHIIYGEFDDAWPIAAQNELARRTDAVLSVVPGAGHCPNEDAPLLTSELLIAFWRRHD